MPNKETLAQICENILLGMTEREACILAEFPYASLQIFKEQSEDLRELLEKKEIEFKFNHLKEIQKSKSEKSSMWVLEKLRPEVFAGKRPGGEGPTINIISTIIKEIQNGNQGLVRISRGAKIRDAHESNPAGKLVGAGLLK
jgi:hypothetical protein